MFEFDELYNELIDSYNYHRDQYPTGTVECLDHILEERDASEYVPTKRLVQEMCQLDRYMGKQCPKTMSELWGVVKNYYPDYYEFLDTINEFDRRNYSR